MGSGMTKQAFFRFNEAAGIPRGRPEPADRQPRHIHSFNEAAGIPRGRPDRQSLPVQTLVLASMRPRVFPAEDMAPYDELPPAQRVLQ